MAIMFDHAVKYGGKYYPPNTPIEEAPAKVPKEPGGGNTLPNTEAPKKATRGRKKGDA